DFSSASGSWNRFEMLGKGQALAGIITGTATTLGGGVVQNSETNGAAGASATLTLNGSGSYLFHGHLRDCGNAAVGTEKLSLVKGGTGTQTLIGEKISYSGNTTVNAGTLVFTPVNADLTLSSVTKTINAGGTMKVDLSPQTTPYRQTNLNTTAIESGGVLELYGTADNVNSHYLINAWTATGTGAIRVSGGGSIANWTGANNTLSGFTGLLDIQNGRFAVNINSSSTLGGTLDVNIATTGKLDLRSGHFTIDALDGATGSVVHKSYTGDTINFTIGNADGSGNFAGVMQGTNYNIIKTGTGTQTLGGTNTYTGTTTVSAGTLLINGSQGNIATTVAAAGTLGGLGTLAGTVSNSGTLAPGSNGIGNLTVNNTVTLAGGSKLAWQITNWTGAAGTGFDKLTATSLNLTASSANRITIKPAELALANFSETNATFVIVQTISGITGFSADKFTIDTSGLTLPHGTWAVQQSGNNLLLAYTAPVDNNSNGILDSWEIAYFGNASPGANPSNGDSDHDGLTNLMEYALGLNPIAPTANPLVHEFESLGDGKHLRIIVPKNPAATNLTYTVETGGALNDWSAATTTIESNTATQLIVRDNVTQSAASRRFIRVKVVAQ
ncbi:MAG TPA: autotransporter-associated beta strand repeat-containing protein, partial [Luteolibacter sp.]